MAYPTGSGSEILRRGAIAAQNDTATSFKFDGTHPSTGTSSDTVPSLHIITMLSITVCCTSAVTDQKFDIWLNSPSVFIIKDQLLTTDQTFTYSDRFVLIGGDSLKINAESLSNFDVYYSYIDQDWS